MNKKLALLSFLVCLLLPNFFALAANPIGIGENLDIGAAIYNIADYLFYIFGGAAVIAFILAGFKFLTAQGDPSKIKQSKEAVVWGVVGVGIALISVSIGDIVKNLLGV